MSAHERCRAALELGRDHAEYGRYTLGRLSGRTVWAISVGASPDSPSLGAKGDERYPNEDGLLVLEDGDRVLLAVADAHFGREAGHELLEELAGKLPPVPAGADELAALVRELARRDSAADYASETTLLIAVYERAARRGFGLSFGDSSFASLGQGGHRLPIGSSSGHPSSGGTRPRGGSFYVSPARPGSLNPAVADTFHFEAAPGDLLLAYTDGIDECHYREPETSVTPQIMAELWREAGSQPEAYVRRLVELALAGIDGHPGGQDNLAVVATQA
jgi:serine/threonine protein phosphatase PrpC